MHKNYMLFTLLGLGLMSLVGCGNVPIQTETSIAKTDNTDAVSEKETQVDSVDIYNSLPQDIDMMDFLNVCFGNSVKADLSGETLEAKQFQVQVEDREYTGHIEKNNISIRAANPTSYNQDFFSKEDIKRICDELVNNLSVELDWDSVKLKECSLESDTTGSYCLLVYEFDIAGIPVIGDLGFAVPDTAGEEFISGEYITIEYGTELRSVTAAHIRKSSDISDTVKIISEVDAEKAVNVYFERLEQEGLEINQTKKNMQLVYIPYPENGECEKMIPAWVMNSETDSGEQYAQLSMQKQDMSI